MDAYRNDSRQRIKQLLRSEYSSLNRTLRERCSGDIDATVNTTVDRCDAARLTNVSLFASARLGVKDRTVPTGFSDVLTDAVGRIETINGQCQVTAGLGACGVF